jgi:ABC-type uncharacterized transport system permease subunit
MERSSDVTREVVLIIQAIIILLITAEQLFPRFQQWWRDRRGKEVAMSRMQSTQLAQI